MKNINIIFVEFLIMVFILGIYMYSSKKLDNLFDNMDLENMENQKPNKKRKTRKKIKKQ